MPRGYKRLPNIGVLHPHPDIMLPDNTVRILAELPDAARLAEDMKILAVYRLAARTKAEESETAYIRYTGVFVINTCELDMIT